MYPYTTYNNYPHTTLLDRSDPRTAALTRFHCPAQGIKIDGLRWPTLEHYYQANRFDTKHWQDIVDTKTTGALQKLIASYPPPSTHLPKDTIRAKHAAIVLHALRVRAMDDEEFRMALLKTGNTPIYDYASVSKFWGANDKGKNMYGWLLMQVRDELRANTILP